MRGRSIETWPRSAPRGPKPRRLGADLVVTPEFSIAGYPPEDLVRKHAFVARCTAALEALARDTADGGPGLIVGGPWQDGDKIYNAALSDGWRRHHRTPRQA